jgi:predicted AAA+ superfamily ATPase
LLPTWFTTHYTLYSLLVTWKSKENRKPLLLKGARQVGKTWLIEEFGNNEFRTVHTFIAHILVNSLDAIMAFIFIAAM